MTESARRIQVCPLCGGKRLQAILDRKLFGRTWRLMRCRSCSLCLTDPRPTSDDLAEFYSNDYHSELCRPGVAEKLWAGKFSRYIDAITKFIDSGRSLDIGCSIGLFPKMLQDRGFEATGVELNPKTAAWGRAHYGIRIRPTVLEPSTMESDRYDLVTVVDVLEHQPDPIAFLLQVRGIIKSDGYCFVSFPNIDSIESRYYRLLASSLARDWLWLTCSMPYHTWEFNPQTAEALFSKCGFDVVDVRFHYGAKTPTLPGLKSVLAAPSYLLTAPMLSRRYGTHMEFLLQAVQGHDLGGAMQAPSKASAAL